MYTYKLHSPIFFFTLRLTGIVRFPKISNTLVLVFEGTSNCFSLGLQYYFGSVWRWISGNIWSYYCNTTWKLLSSAWSRTLLAIFFFLSNLIYFSIICYNELQETTDWRTPTPVGRTLKVLCIVNITSSTYRCQLFRNI